MQTLAGRLGEELSDIAVADAINGAGSSVLSIIQLRPSATKALAHKKLHVYPFKDVPLCWRRVYEDACLWEAITLLKEQNDEATFGDDDDVVTKIVQLADSAIIFAGAPLRRDLIIELLESVTAQLDFSLGASGQAGERDSLPAAKRRRLALSGASEDGGASELLQFSPAPRSQPLPIINSLRAVPRVKTPSLSIFAKHLDRGRTPLIITDSIEHWPASKRWMQPQYWLDRTHGGRRLVPVELGRSYTDEGWGQKIMPFGEYLRDHVLRDAELDPNDWNKAIGTGAADQSGTDGTVLLLKGYLAQHDLLGQVPALRNDISIPDYCYLDPPRTDSAQEDEYEPREPQLNIWLGPAGTISPAHTDPHENILAQVVGRKYVRLFAPGDDDKMYPMSSSESDAEHEESNGVNMSNTSRVDVGSFVSWSHERPRHNENEDQDRFPVHSKAEYVEGILEAGECLYIPRGWWHYIHSLSASCSVSFWWD